MQHNTIPSVQYYLGFSREVTKSDTIFWFCIIVHMYRAAILRFTIVHVLAAVGWSLS